MAADERLDEMVDRMGTMFRGLTAAAQEKLLERLRQESDTTEVDDDEREARNARLLRFAGDARHLEHANDPDESQTTRARRASSVPRHLQESRAQGLAAIDQHTDVLDAKAADRLEQVVEEDVAGPEMGLTARYLAAVGDPHYNAAFGKMLAEPTGAHLRWTPREHEAWDRVVKVTSEQRALGLGSQGGSYPIPFVVDPSVMLTSNGAINPIRQIADVRTIVGNHWTGVASTGTTAAYSAEGTETTDGSPTLTQPTADVEKYQCFVPFSIEVGEDWASLQQELANLVQDAKDVMESTQFLIGLGHASHVPQGLLVGGTLVANTAGTAAFAIGDVYTLAEAVPARWRPTMRWVASPTILDKVHRLVGGGNTTELPVMPDRGGGILGKPAYEWSDMATATTTGSSIIAAGDFTASYLILDRVGMSAEIVSHLFGTVANYPNGMRGIYAYGRNTGLVKVPNAFRTLKVT